ncbi:hypothetical protein LSM04_002897 [Trypanosoma melophagium]|uniref:uncharacterized protein n=1 Tax=Trypanosoma melophagium TaxID=715481 RepID=UPI00351A2B24|nr:hypothetical protein LSM04_002897 [Trypanosoma melophagium]
MIKGKNTNSDLDLIYGLYMPPKSALPCMEVGELDDCSIQVLKRMADMAAMQKKRMAGATRGEGRHDGGGEEAVSDKHYSQNTTGLIYIPLFTRSHWIAGVFSLSSITATSNNIHSKQLGSQQRQKYVLRVYDSAPSPPVERDVRRAFRPFDDSITVEFVPTPRQVRFSEDCGIFMSICFFAFAVNVNVHITPGLTKMVRHLFDAVLRHREKPPTRAFFLSRLKCLLELQTDDERQLIFHATMNKWLQQQHQQRHTHQLKKNPSRHRDEGTLLYGGAGASPPSQQRRLRGTNVNEEEADDSAVRLTTANEETMEPMEWSQPQGEVEGSSREGEEEDVTELGVVETVRAETKFPAEPKRRSIACQARRALLRAQLNWEVNQRRKVTYILSGLALKKRK